MSQTRRTCSFCGRPGSSREHIIAEWVGRVMTPRAEPGIRIIFDHHSENPATGLVRPDKRTKGPAYYTRAFCRSCNTGWMSRLEQQVEPIMTPLLLGLEERELGVAEQRALSFWALKTVLAYQALEEPVTTFARDEDYAELYRQQAPLPNAQVWLGANAHDETSWYRANSVRRHDAPDGAVEGFSVTLTLGHAVFYVIVGHTGRVGVRLRYGAALAVKEIWPGRGRSVVWPPSVIVREREPQALSEYLLGRSVLING